MEVIVSNSQRFFLRTVTLQSQPSYLLSCSASNIYIYISVCNNLSSLNMWFCYKNIVMLDKCPPKYLHHDYMLFIRTRCKCGTIWKLNLWKIIKIFIFSSTEKKFLQFSCLNIYTKLSFWDFSVFFFWNTW